MYRALGLFQAFSTPASDIVNRSAFRTRFTLELNNRLLSAALKGRAAIAVGTAQRLATSRNTQS